MKVGRDYTFREAVRSPLGFPRGAASGRARWPVRHPLAGSRVESVPSPGPATGSRLGSHPRRSRAAPRP